jgi:hypothetical protein
MKFLSKLGKILVQATQIITGLGPLIPQVSPYVDKVSDIVTKAIGIIVNVEAIGQLKGMSGEEKLAAATPMVTQIILTSDSFAGRKIKNQELFKSGTAKFTSGLVDILNSIDEDEIKTEEIK